jgi:hypothetical protein
VRLGDMDARRGTREQTRVHYLRIAVIVALGCAGLLNGLWMIKRQSSPVEARGHLFAGLACIWLAGAVFAQGQHKDVIAVLMLLASIVSGGLWFYHIFRQSLHNTTM